MAPPFTKSWIRHWIYITDRKATTGIGKAFSAPRVNPAALPLVHCYSVRLPRRVASWVNYSSRRTESSNEHFVSHLSLLKADELWCESKRCSDWNPWPMDPKASAPHCDRPSQYYVNLHMSPWPMQTQRTMLTPLTPRDPRPAGKCCNTEGLRVIWLCGISSYTFRY